MELTTEASTPLSSFHLFTALPVELRLEIWRCSFHRRVLVFHQRAMYPSQPNQSTNGNPLVWQSNCANHPALSACPESRLEALSHYAVPMPVGARGNMQRVLHLNPELDTIVALGSHDPVVELLYDIRRHDPSSRIPKRVGIGFNNWVGQLEFFVISRTILHFLTEELLGGMEQLVLLMYAELLPPADFRNGECVLENYGGWEPLWRVMFSGSKNGRFEDGWLVIDDVRVRVMNLGFRKGPNALVTSA